MKEAVCRGLESRWSPQMIAAKYNERHPENRVGHSTIYRALKMGLLEGYKEKTHLRRRGKRKYCRGDSSAVRPEHTIHQRPAIAESRGRFGDWEVDTLLGRVGSGGLVSAVDRKSRYVRLAIIRDKTAAETERAVCRALCGKRVETLTTDNGSEFSNFKGIEKKLRATVYFTDPHSPWQKGGIENVNGLLRWFFPKGCDFRKVTEDEVKQVQDIINLRPRKCLGWLTPAELFLASCCT